MFAKLGEKVCLHSILILFKLPPKQTYFGVPSVSLEWLNLCIPNWCTYWPRQVLAISY